MRPKYINNLWRFILALVGGFVMLFAGEIDHPLTVIADDYFFLNWLGASASAYLMFAVQHLTLRLTDILCPFKIRSNKYFYRRGLVQFFVSFVPSLLTGIFSAWLLVTVLAGIPLQDTSYFYVDIYIVFVTLVLMQMNQGYKHKIWTLRQFEEVTCWTTDEVVILSDQEDWEDHLQRSLSYQRITALLEAWKDEDPEEEEPVEAVMLIEEAVVEIVEVVDVDAEELEEVGEIIEEEESPKVLSKTELSYTKALEALDWRKAALFYAENKSNFVVDWNGDLKCWDTSLDFVTTHMDAEKYFRAAPHFIVHKALVEDVKKVGNGQFRLLLKLKVDFDTRISRVKTQLFRKWYPVKANSASVRKLG